MQKDYHVLREHYGDKQYARGDIRSASPGDVAHLVQSGVLRETSLGKADLSLVKNKAEPASKKNK
jgi:hypothetical protein